jgi:hypothetical protein
MDRVLILSTHWREDYWKSNGEMSARYPSTEYTSMDDWDEVSENIPLSGIGMYHTRLKEEPFVYIVVKELSHNPRGEPKFVLESVGESETESYELNERLRKRLYYTVDSDSLRGVLDELDENPPDEWLAHIDG